MGLLKDLAEKAEKSMEKAGKHLNTSGGKAVVVAAAIVAEAPTVALQMKKAANRIRERVAEEMAESAKSSKDNKKSSSKKKSSR
jgi:hypothetical protein